MPVNFVLRLDDICETMDWEKVSRIVSFALARSIAPLLGVVPDNRDADLDRYPRIDEPWDRIREWQAAGADIAQHGYQHVRITTARGLFGPFPASEFAALPLDEQRRRISLGHAILAERGLQPCAFMAPFHSLDAATVDALRLETPIRIVTDGVALSSYRFKGMTFVPSMFATAVIPIGVRTIVLHANTMSEAAVEEKLAWIDERQAQFVSIAAAAHHVPGGAVSLGSRALGRGLRVAGRTRSRFRQSRAAPARSPHDQSPSGRPHGA